MKYCGKKEREIENITTEDITKEEKIMKYKMSYVSQVFICVIVLFSHLYSVFIFVDNSYLLL